MLLIMRIKCVAFLILLLMALAAIIFFIRHRRGILTYTTNRDSKYSWPIRTRKTHNGCIALSIDYKLDTLSISKALTVPDNLVMNYGARMKQMTFDDIAELPQSQWKATVPREAYLVYPQPIDLVETVKHLMEGNPISVAPINAKPLRFRQLPKAVCHPLFPQSHTYDVVVAVKSAVQNSESRQLFREQLRRYTNASPEDTAQLRVGLVFILGYPAPQVENHNNYANPNVSQEILLFDDMVVGDFQDTYINLTMKMIHTYQWAATFCRKNRPLFIFMDDDFQLNIKNLGRIVKSNSKAVLESQFIGDVQLNAPVSRPMNSKNPKWELRKDEFPFPKYPTYARGAATVVGFHTVERLALGMLFTKPLHIEDTFIGLVSAKLNITYINNFEFVDDEKL